MKTTFLLLLCFVPANIFAQTTTPATASQLQQQQKKAQEALDKLTPEQRQLMEQMGIKIPTSVPVMPAGVTNAQVTAAVGGVGVPARNAALIAAIPKVTITAATLPAYIKILNDYVDKKLPSAEKTVGQNNYSALKTNKYPASEIGNLAMGFWAAGQLEPAVYIQGRAAADDPGDANLLSNFAAMLSMGGAPHMAVPLLEYLNKQYPDNSTILNNLGQAWFYMGETDKADATLEQAVRAFAYNPQANYTQCLIAESKGNTAKAIQKLQNSLKYSVTLAKLNKLRKLGGKIKANDLRVPFKPDPDPLGLRQFTRPDFPKNYDEEVRLKYEWDNFQKSVTDKTEQLNKQLMPYIQAATQKAAQQASGGNGVGIGVGSISVSGSSTTNAKPNRLYEQTATRNLEEMDKDGGAEYRLKTAKAQVDSIVKDFQAQKDAKHKEIEKQNSIIAQTETELGKKGENLGYDNCKVQEAYSEWVHTTYNTPLDEAYKNYLHQLSLKITEELYWKQFIQSDDQFEVTKLQTQKEWLAAVGFSRYLESAYITGNNICTHQAADQSLTHKLADFDELHCDHTSTIDFIAYKQVVRCNTMSVELNASAGVVSGSGKFNFQTDSAGKDRFVNGTIEASAEVGSKSRQIGPVTAGASARAGAGMEISSQGIEDVYVTGEVTAGAGVGNQNVEITASGQVSLISGNVSGGISGFAP